MLRLVPLSGDCAADLLSLLPRADHGRTLQNVDCGRQSVGKCVSQGYRKNKTLTKYFDSCLESLSQTAGRNPYHGRQLRSTEQFYGHLAMVQLEILGLMHYYQFSRDSYHFVIMEVS